MTDDIIKIKARHTYTKYPRFPDVLGGGGEGEGTYGIVDWRVSECVSVTQGRPDTANDNEDWERDLNKRSSPKFPVHLGETITIVGTYYSELDEDKDTEYTIIAKESEHPKYGVQYRLIYIGKVIDFTDVKNQRTFLKSFLTDNQVEQIYNVCDNPLDIISKHDKDTLTKAWGIGDYISECIFNRFEECKDNCEVYIQLDEFGLTPNLIQKLVATYHDPARVVAIVKNNPYRLCFDCDGIGFKKADDIAAKGGIQPTSTKRIKGFVYTYLNQEAETGNSYVTVQKLLLQIYEQLGGKEAIMVRYAELDKFGATNNIASSIEQLKQEGVIGIFGQEKSPFRRVFLTKIYELEKSVAEELCRIASAHSEFEVDGWQNRVAEQERKQGWCLTDEQMDGVRTCLNNQVAFVSGNAGSGKSSVVSAVLHAFDCFPTPTEDGEYCDGKYSFAQCALSGKAAARMEELTHCGGYTIHRLLGYNGSGFKHDAHNPLSYDIIILDEISMVGGEIFLNLLKAIPNGTKLIILGDMGQLESIGYMNLAHDLTESPYVKHVELTKIHRQAQKSGIITLSQEVRHENSSSLKQVGSNVIGELQDMHVTLDKENDQLKPKIIQSFRDQYHELLSNGYGVMDIQVLTPLKERGSICINALNHDLQEIVNPQDHNFLKNELAITGRSKGEETTKFVLREGDKVMCIRNNPGVQICVPDDIQSPTSNGNNSQDKLSSNKKDTSQSVSEPHTASSYDCVDEDVNTSSDIPTTPIFNGWVGLIEKIDTRHDNCIIFFPHVKKRVIMTCKEVSNHIILGYVCTVHKYQGSQAKYIIGTMDYSVPPMMRTKELLYTMLTRASDRCTLIAQQKAVSTCCHNSGIKDKDTFLPELLEEVFAKYEKRIQSIERKTGTA